MKSDGEIMEILAAFDLTGSFLLAQHPKSPRPMARGSLNDPCRDSDETYVATHHRVELRGFEP